MAEKNSNNVFTSQAAQRREEKGEYPSPLFFDVLEKMGISKENVAKLNEAAGDMPKGVADSVITLISKAREIGLLENPKNNSDREPKMGGSMLSRQNYDEGGKSTITAKEHINSAFHLYDLGQVNLEDSLLMASRNLAMAKDEEELDTLRRQVKEQYAETNEEYPRSINIIPPEMKDKIDNFKVGDSAFKTFEESSNKAMGGRIDYQEGGSLMVPPEMEDMADDMPVDTYPNNPPDEMAEAEASQLPDAEMEDKYMDFVVNESLDNEEQSYLMNALEADPMLSQIFDKVVTTASEFTGAGEVEGPGTGVSDSIPARLSDGEFVFTKKATDQMGSDNLQMMMDDAERAFDGGEMRMPKQEGGMMMYKQKDEDPLAYEKIAQDEIKKNMLRANRAPSLLGVN